MSGAVAPRFVGGAILLRIPPGCRCGHQEVLAPDRPEGEYGAGRVEIWDRGPYRLIERRPEKIVFELRGEKLRGVYILLFFKADRQRNWLFFRPAEGAEKPGR